MSTGGGLCSKSHVFFCCSSPRFLSLSAAMERHLPFGSDRTLEFVADFSATVSGPLMVAVVSEAVFNMNQAVWAPCIKSAQATTSKLQLYWIWRECVETIA
jgi:hypothetical protein